MRTHPRTVRHAAVAADVLLAVGLAATMLVELWRDTSAGTETTPLSVAVVVVASAPVLLRRTRPIVALVVAMVALYAVMAVVDIYQTVPFPSMVCGYAVALATDRRRTIVTGLVLVPFVLLAIAVFGHELLVTTELLQNLAFVAAPLMLGSAVRERRAHVQSLVERAEEAERTRDEEARRRVSEERLRIARDVHDVVAHAMVAINVQAGVGAHLLDRDPERARRTLADIKRVSGEALDDLRGTIETLRSDEEEGAAPVAPAQSLAQLDDLGEGLRSAGVEVDLDIDPAAMTLPAALTTTGYRIIQEALTNVVRHAGGSHATVRVAREGGHLVIDVSDDGCAGEPDPGPPGGTGNGIRGMRERALAAGGSLAAGPRAEGGWRVVATLPVVRPVA